MQLHLSEEQLEMWSFDLSGTTSQDILPLAHISPIENPTVSNGSWSCTTTPIEEQWTWYGTFQMSWRSSVKEVLWLVSMYWASAGFILSHWMMQISISLVALVVCVFIVRALVSVSFLTILESICLADETQ